MPDLLNTLRGENIQPQWQYLNELLRIQKERMAKGNDPLPPLRLSPEPPAIDAELRHLHPEDRAAILTVARHEINMILWWCKVQARGAQLRRAHGI